MKLELRSPRPPAAAEAELTDAELLALFVSARDDDAFRALVQRHGGLVLAVCRRVLGDERDAEDAFQAVFLLLSRRAAELARPELLSAWLYGVAYRTALKLRDQNRRRRDAERRGAPAAAAAPSLDLAWREVQQVLDEEIGRLDESLRAPLVLCYLEGKTHQEAARAMGRPAGSMSWLIARALDVLRGRLVQRGVTLSASLPVLLLLLRGREALCERLSELAVRAALGYGWAAEALAVPRRGLVTWLPGRRGAALALALLLLGGLGLGAAAAWSAPEDRPELTTPAGPEITSPVASKCGQHHGP